MSEYRRKCLSEKEAECSICGVEPGRNGIDVHHINGDRSDNRMENLLPLCTDCHKNVHTASYDGLETQHLQEELPDNSFYDNADGANQRYRSIKIPKEDWVRHKRRKELFGLTWVEYLDGGEEVQQKIRRNLGMVGGSGVPLPVVVELIDELTDPSGLSNLSSTDKIRDLVNQWRDRAEMYSEDSQKAKHIGLCADELEGLINNE